MLSLYCILLLFAGFISHSQGYLRQVTPLDDESIMNFKQMAQLHGYPVLEYSIPTGDGYYLTVHRIPGSRNETVFDALKASFKKQDVLVLHGVSSQSQAMIVSGPGLKPSNSSNNTQQGKAFPYQLADSNYDVWMMNARGNIQSRRHIYLDPDTEKEFWDFTFEEVAEYDLKATFDFILKEKGEDTKVTLIGYSQGTTSITYALNEFADYYQDKVNLFVALAPSIYFQHSREDMLVDLAKLKKLHSIALEMGFLEFHDNGMEPDFKNDFVYIAKTDYSWVCYLSDVCTLKKTITPEYLDQSPSIDIKRSDPERLAMFLKIKGGTSTKNLIHMAQLFGSQRFQKFDYGKAKNLKLYGSAKPAEIDLKKSKVPTLLVAAGDDVIADYQDVKRLSGDINNLVDMKFFPDEDHLSLSFSKNMTYFQEVMEVMGQFRQ